MAKRTQITRTIAVVALVLGWLTAPAYSSEVKEYMYPMPELKPQDSVLKVRVGDVAPDFTLPSVKGETVTLSQYRARKNVVISFVPAAWTPVCSDQWPGYNMAESLFTQHDAVLLGITVDNIPTLYSWTKEMCSDPAGLWFPVLSDFYPHGKVAEQYGVLRPEGVSERALLVIDKQGIIRYIDVHDINTRPRLDELAQALEKLSQTSE
ncbi:MAG TPA: peroxiredoxin [Thermodesulfobacteriota bacterium]|nr:peroxiredoxin [Deltaproteobacteria bacterium]HNR14158.1 peroxiredoxin [Thermodesulfobacteriota bacterium]HNU72684.1 peroxiredoxin [Thermodesulfobacteriota bacterium]HOC39013.1 peroxiredoxin [Thermodesulfobacteriota bacterium]HQO76991.1 peroxiredoxin [Thermodesulfobacteriota bacterium]